MRPLAASLRASELFAVLLSFLFSILNKTFLRNYASMFVPAKPRLQGMDLERWLALAASEDGKRTETHTCDSNTPFPTKPNSATSRLPGPVFKRVTPEYRQMDKNATVASTFQAEKKVFCPFRRFFRPYCPCKRLRTSPGRCRTGTAPHSSTASWYRPSLKFGPSSRWSCCRNRYMAMRPTK